MAPGKRLFESIPVEVALLITVEITIPIIGIGADVHCDGQVLGTHDMRGLYPSLSWHMRTYCDLREVVSEALARYRTEVRDGRFPGEENSFHMPEDEVQLI